MRGFGSGLVWGGCLGLFGLAVASQLAPLPPDPDRAPPAASGLAAGAAPAGSEFARPLPETEPLLPVAAPPPTTSAAPKVPEPQPASAVPAADTSLPATSVSVGMAPTGPVLTAPDRSPDPGLPEDAGAVLPRPSGGAAPAAPAAPPVLDAPPAAP
jgi:hypothetical protein